MPERTELDILKQNRSRLAGTAKVGSHLPGPPLAGVPSNQITAPASRGVS